MKNVLKVVLVVAAISLVGCKDKVQDMKNSSVDGMLQYGPECNRLGKDHKPIKPGGCTKQEWAEWNKNN